MERLRRTLRWRNSSTQTRAEAVGLANQAGETFFHGVRDMTMQNPTVRLLFSTSMVVRLSIRSQPINAYYIPQTLVLLNLMA